MIMKLLQHRLIITALFLYISAYKVYAADYSSEQSYLEEFPVVLSASRLTQPLSEAPNAVTVIDRAMIKASGFRTIPDLFRLVPGMFVGFTDGNTPIVAYHGSTEEYSRRMQVLIDGRSVYLPPVSNVNWEDIPLQIDDIERIEVIRGPAAASHGANSLQGVVNIITRDASSVRGTDVSVATGSDGVSDVSLHMGKSGSELDYRATLAYRADHGYATSILNDDHATGLANLRANYHSNATNSFDFQLGYNAGTRGFGIEGRPDTDPFHDARTSTSFQQITWLHALPQHDELKLNYSHTFRHYSVSFYNNFLNTPVSKRETVSRHELELQHTTQLNADNRLVWGGGMRTEAVESSVFLASPQSLRQSRLFAHDEWRMVDSAVLNAGAMLENDEMGHKNTSPRVALNYHLTPKHTLRMGTSIAYRNPAIVEEHGFQPGATPIAADALLALGGNLPEKILSREIGYLGEYNAIGTTVDARIYHDSVSDIIYYDPSPIGPPDFNGRPYSLSNLMSATYQGFETTIKYRWGENSNLIFNFSRQMASCSVTGTLREPLFLPILQGIADSCTLMVPWNSGSILLTQQLSPDVHFSAGYYHQGELTFLDAQAPLSIMRRLDMRIARTFGNPNDRGGEVALVVQNALLDNYTDYGSTPQTAGQIRFGRRAYLSATLRF